MDPDTCKFLGDPVNGVSRTPVYVELKHATEHVLSSEEAWLHLQRLPQPLTAKLVSPPDHSVQLQLCDAPRIVAGRSPHRSGHGQEEILEIIGVLQANGVIVSLAE